MSNQRKLLLETLLGHLELLQEAHPKKAATPLARKTRRYAKLTLKKQEQGPRRIAA